MIEVYQYGEVSPLFLAIEGYCKLVLQIRKRLNVLKNIKFSFISSSSQIKISVSRLFNTSDTTLWPLFVRLSFYYKKYVI